MAKKYITLDDAMTELATMVEKMRQEWALFCESPYIGGGKHMPGLPNYLQVQVQSHTHALEQLEIRMRELNGEI